MDTIIKDFVSRKLLMCIITKLMEYEMLRTENFRGQKINYDIVHEGLLDAIKKELYS